MDGRPTSGGLGTDEIDRCAHRREPPTSWPAPAQPSAPIGPLHQWLVAHRTMHLHGVPVHGQHVPGARRISRSNPPDRPPPTPVTAAHAPEAEFTRLDLSREHGCFVVLSAMGHLQDQCESNPHAKMQTVATTSQYILPTLPLAIIIGPQDENLTHIYRGN